MRVLLVLPALAVALIAGCAQAPPPELEPAPTTPAPPRPSTPQPSPSPVPWAISMTFTCEVRDDDRPRLFDIELDYDEPADFSKIWDADPLWCQLRDRRLAGHTNPWKQDQLAAIEQEALDASDYGQLLKLRTLYEVCASPYAERDHTSREWYENFKEALIDGVESLKVLCPDRPNLTALFDEFQAEAEAEERDRRLEEEGRLFYNGTFLVGVEIQPGTYYIEGDIKDCYWERQNAAGGIVDNAFHLGARRVEVTIRSSDYAFLSQGCEGPWRPATG